MPVVAGPPYYCRWADPSSCARPSASAPWWRPPSSSSSPCPPWTSWPPSSTTPPSSPTRTQRTRSHSSKTVLNVSPLDYLWYGISDKWTCASLCSIFKLERELFATSLFINYNYVIKEALKQHLFWYKMIFGHCILTNSASKFSVLHSVTLGLIWAPLTTFFHFGLPTTFDHSKPNLGYNWWWLRSKLSKKILPRGLNRPKFHLTRLVSPGSCFSVCPQCLNIPNHTQGLTEECWGQRCQKNSRPGV